MQSPAPQSPPGSSKSLHSFALQDFDDFNHDIFLNNFELSNFNANADNDKDTAYETEIQQLNMNLDMDQFPITSLDMNGISSSKTGIALPSYELDSGTSGTSGTSGSSSKGSESQNSDFSEEENLKRHFPHVHALAVIIKTLEAHAANNKIAIDEAMRINQACMAKITKIMELKEYKICTSCPMLVSTALDIMLSLYENGISSEARHAQSSSSSSPPPRITSNLPNFQFGVFQVDPEERIAFSNLIIRKELRRYTQVIKTLSAGRQGQEDDRSSFGRVHTSWMLELENRVENLVTSL